MNTNEIKKAATDRKIIEAANATEQSPVTDNSIPQNEDEMEFLKSISKMSKIMYRPYYHLICAVNEVEFEGNQVRLGIDATDHIEYLASLPKKEYSILWKSFDKLNIKAPDSLAYVMEESKRYRTEWEKLGQIPSYVNDTIAILDKKYEMELERL